MEVRIYETKITVETLCVDSVPALLSEVAESMRKETIDGVIRKDDGDVVSWFTVIGAKQKIT